MGEFDQEAFNDFVLDNDVIGFFEKPIRLKSGRISHWYVNWRNIAEDAFLLSQLADHVLAFVHDLGLEPDCFYGVPEGATKLGIITQYKMAVNAQNFDVGTHPMPMGRGKPKEHGAPKDKYFVGQPRGDTIVLEDVTTTGGSLLTTIDGLFEADIPVIAAFGMTNRMELRDDRTSVQDAVEAKRVPYEALSNAIDLLPRVYAKLNPGEQIAAAIEAEFEQYGVEPLKLR